MQRKPSRHAALHYLLDQVLDSAKPRFVSTVKWFLTKSAEFVKIESRRKVRKKKTTQVY